MTDRASSLKIALLDRGPTASVVKATFEGIHDVLAVTPFEEPNDVLGAFQNDAINTLLINIFTVGITPSIELINAVRVRFPHAPICLIGNRESLVELPDVPDAWKKRFDHYFMLPIDDVPEQLVRRSEGIAKLLEAYLKSICESFEVKKYDRSPRGRVRSVARRNGLHR